MAMMQQHAKKLITARLLKIQNAFTSQPEVSKSVESKKSVIEISFWVALRRCTVHLLPLTISVAIITLNIKGYYIGAEFSSLIKYETVNLLFLQVASKLHELLIVASLTTIIFHLARQELLFGGGLPLGLIGSGLLFANMGYFVSKEFWGSITYKAENRWRKWGFLFTLLVAGITATLAGPSSATLLVPKTQPWSAGGTSFYLDGSRDDFWPVYLTAESYADQSYCFSDNATQYGVCPSGGFRSLWEHYGRSDSSNFYKANVATPYSKELSGSSYYFPVNSPLSQVPPVYALGNSRQVETQGYFTFLIQPHAATVIMLQQITTDWWKALLSVTRKAAKDIDGRVAQSTGLSTLAQVRCSPPQNMTVADTAVQFPRLSTDGWVWYGPESTSVSVLGAPIDHLRHRWYHLPPQFGASSIGSIFESAWTPDNYSRAVVGCTVYSGYIETTLFTDQYSFWTGWYPWNTIWGHRYPAFSSTNQQNPSNGRIALNDTWLSLLTPPTPAEGPGYYSWAPSTIESILMNSGFDNISPNLGNTTTEAWHNGDLTGSSKSMLLESIITSVLVDGLSRSGSARMYNTTGPVHTWNLASYNKKSDFDNLILKGRDALDPPHLSLPQNITKMKIDLKISGFAYQTSLPEMLSITLLLVHIVFALCHTLWILSTRETSDSWDSVSKIVALAQNSRPPNNEVLQNTSSNIEKLDTYATRAKVRAVQLPGSSDFDHVELIFCDEKVEGLRTRRKTIETSEVELVEQPVIQLVEQPVGNIDKSEQHLHASTWPRDSSTSFVSDTMITDPRQSARRNSAASLLSHVTAVSAWVESMPVDRRNSLQYR